jgi:hypothetical protein
MKEKNYEVEQYQRDSLFAELKQWCFGHGRGERDYIEVNEWANGDGFDVDIETNNQF